MECARQLLKQGEKVLFLIRSHASNDFPTLLNLKLQKYFREKPDDNTKPNYDPNADAERGTFAAVPQTDTTQDANVDTSSNK